MKKINVVSDVYKNTAINFNGFVVNFDAEGKGVLNFDEKETKSVEEVFEVHPNIYKGDKLPIKEKVEAPVKEEGATEVATANIELEHLKESNKTLALENASLKKENETFKKEKEELENKICTLMQEAKVEKPAEEEKKESESKEEKPADETETKEGEGDGTESEGDKDKNIIKEDLNKKTVTQLKDLLNTDDFLPFKEEWKNLTKKDDIVNFILKRIEE